MPPESKKHAEIALLSAQNEENPPFMLIILWNLSLKRGGLGGIISYLTYDFVVETRYLESNASAFLM